MIEILRAIAEHWIIAMLFGVFVGLAVGLGIGLVKAFKTRIAHRKKRRELEEEIDDLRDHIHRQMEISAKGNSALEGELKDLREKNENLRVTVKTLENKPGRAELRQLHVYDRAVRLMNERAPGFASAWENAVREAEKEVDEAETGVRALMRRVTRRIPMLGGETTESPMLEGAGEESDSGEAESHDEETSAETS